MEYYIEDICLYVCKMKFYFIEWALKTVFSRDEIKSPFTQQTNNFSFYFMLKNKLETKFP
jgi:hypothetical protein